MMPSQVLDARMAELGGHSVVWPVTTSVRSKENAFGYIKLLLQRGRTAGSAELSGMLKQLRSLQFESFPTGGMRI